MPIDLIEQKRQRESDKAAPRYIPKEPGKSAPRNLLAEKRQKESGKSAPRNLLAEKRQREGLQKQSPGMLSAIGSGIMNLGSGLVGGAAQSAYDMTKSAANLGIGAAQALGDSRSLQYSMDGGSDFDEWEAARNPGEQVGGQSPVNPVQFLSGQSNEKLARVPEMDLMEKNPESSLKRVGQFVGGMAPPMALGGYVGKFGAPAGEAAMGALGGSGPIASLVGRALGASGVGAAEGYVTGDEANRSGSAILGGASAGAVQLGGDLMRARSAAIARQVRSRVDGLQDAYGNQFEAALGQAEELGANKFLKPSYQSSYDIIEDSAHSKLGNALGEFQKNPTLSNAHRAQSDLGKILRDPKAAGSKAYEEAGKAQNRILRQISQAFEDSGASDAKSGYEALRKGYAQEVVPYLDSKSVSALIRGELRPKSFAGEALKDQRLLARVGERHPELLLNESLSGIAKSKIGAGLGIGAGLAIAKSSGVGVPRWLEKSLN